MSDATGSASPARRLRRALRRGAFRHLWLTRGFRPEVVYSTDYQLRLPGLPVDALRGERVLAFLLEARLLSRRRIRRPYAVGIDSLRRIHRDRYLASLSEPVGLTRILGYQPTWEQYEAALAAQRLQTGGTRLAARLAVRSGRIVVNLGGGFHHAGPERGGGFCIYNDIAVAIAAERHRGLSEAVLVIDLDLHDGDGTRRAFADDSTVHTLSIHNQSWSHEEAVEATTVELGSEIGDDRFLELLREILPPLVERLRPGLVIYVAGTDPAEDDAIGDWNLTAGGMLTRDRFVVSTLDDLARGTATVVVLGGGYGTHTWLYTARFLAWLLAPGRTVEPPSTSEMTLRYYRRLLPASDLIEGEDPDDWSLTEEEIYGSLDGPPREARFLGVFSRHSIELALARAGLLERLREQGFTEPTLELDLKNPTGQTIFVYGDAAKSELVAELRARRDRRLFPDLELLRVEWLMLQNPRVTLAAEDLPLPGQKHPGLGLLRDVLALLTLTCDDLGLDGLVFVPAHYYMAATGGRFLRFVDPAAEARFRALRKALDGLPLAEATRAVADGGVIDTASGEPVEWVPSPMVLPTDPELAAKVESADYEQQVEEIEAGLSFELTAPRRPAPEPE